MEALTSCGSQTADLYFCDRTGHVKAGCPERQAWLASKGTTAAVSGVPETVSEEHGANPCPCTAGHRAAGGSLPRIYADVRGVGCEEWTRCRSVVDTCSVRTLLSSSVATKVDLSVQPAESSGLIALDGKPIKISGVVSIELQRANDGPVYLPKTTVDAVVVDSLETVDATLLIGADVISSLGGVQLEYGKNNVLCGVMFVARMPRVEPTLLLRLLVTTIRLSMWRSCVMEQTPYFVLRMARCTESPTRRTGS